MTLSHRNLPPIPTTASPCHPTIRGARHRWKNRPASSRRNGPEEAWRGENHAVMNPAMAHIQQNPYGESDGEFPRKIHEAGGNHGGLRCVVLTEAAKLRLDDEVRPVSRVCRSQAVLRACISDCNGMLPAQITLELNPFRREPDLARSPAFATGLHFIALLTTRFSQLAAGVLPSA